VIASLLVAGCGGDPGTSDADVGVVHDAAVVDADVISDAGVGDAGPVSPAVGGLLTGLDLFDGWTEPRALAGDVNTIGWEDSSFIAPDGRRLYFGYTRWDYDELVGNQQIVLTGPERPGDHGGAFDIYEATLDQDGWHVVNSSANDATDIPEAAQGVDRTERYMVFARFAGDADLYETTRTSTAVDWAMPTLLPSPVSTDCVEDNPHVTADGEWLLFDSDRADATGTSCKAPGEPRDLWISARAGATWSAPVLVAGVPNQGLTRFQPFASAGAGEIYWAGASAVDCATSYSCLYRATRQDDGSYANPVLVARASARETAADGDVFAVGEMSITEDGQWLYFTYIEKVDADSNDLSIGVARRP
jgi:hypothetical protein